MVVLMLFLLLPGLSLAAPPALADWASPPYCDRAQRVIAGVDARVRVRVQLHGDYDAFVRSKPGDHPLTVQEHLSNPLQVPGVTQVPGATLHRTLSCKMRTAAQVHATSMYGITAYENGRQGWTGDGIGDGASRQPRLSKRKRGAAPRPSEETSGAAQVHTTCATVHRDMLRQVAAAIPADERKLSPAAFVIEPDATTLMGPTWLRGWPFQPVSRGADGVLRLRARALRVPQRWWIPMPARFKGNHYCHLATPEYLDALLRGTIPSPLPRSPSQ